MTAQQKTLAAILAKYAGHEILALEAGTTLARLGIDVLDIPVILLDIEDAFSVRAEAVGDDDPATVGDLLAVITAGLAAKAAPRAHVQRPRKKGGWMSTVAERA